MAYLDQVEVSNFPAVQTTQDDVVISFFYNSVIASANVEQSLVLPANVKGYMIRSRGSGTLKLSHTSGQSGTIYITIPGRATFTDSKNYVSLTIYFQSPTAGEVVEVIAWQ